MATLGSARSTRKFYSIVREQEFKRYKKESLKVTLSRLHSRGYVENSALGWSITRKGKKHIKNITLLSYINSPFTNDAPVNLILSFDIPEKDRHIRHWLRNQIKIFGYKMLQQSLWIGPGPLPASFLKRLENLNIRKNVKTFKIIRTNK
ncbi:hypothetical protein A2814_02875 [Candidatus Nomurabacteria bacterium RIFCSPHIGHO2_01_FULL_38_19]|uniref:Transcriptional repressor PaaX-like central Cas2-like domain-containing protein n=1 Tax=Candidatus Nomurabacteria bacterium RIFCSPHIGHO2_01_FULL_38_19 TaxID=1801732 RepID=A0A1F6US93_9BACT|nr:MAG: hypothetical protein A2814_02875 [Candidatus Nomurabacteria bacterium RIFCSPHIGHO2_01_FULL_38_19]